jgi:hypothetical protein
MLMVLEIMITTKIDLTITEVINIQSPGQFIGGRRSH